MNKLVNKIKQIFTASKSLSVSDGDNLYAEGVAGVSIPLLSELPDEELIRLNQLLPWASFLVDSKNRRFGKAHTSTKRNTAQIIPDYRSELLDKRFSLKGKAVLEVGCFEGIHTVSLAQKGALVTAFDSRIENIVKTMVRCSAFNVQVNICYWNLEATKPAYIGCYDIVHHVGVLYHLRNPLEHLKEICACTKQVLLLDTHVASVEPLLTENYNGFDYRYWRYEEGGRASPFAGMENYARWMHTDDLIGYLAILGFNKVELVEQRQERNGARVLIIANR